MARDLATAGSRAHTGGVPYCLCPWRSLAECQSTSCSSSAAICSAVVMHSSIHEDCELRGHVVGMESCLGVQVL